MVNVEDNDSGDGDGDNDDRVKTLYLLLCGCIYASHDGQDIFTPFWEKRGKSQSIQPPAMENISWENSCNWDVIFSANRNRS